MADPLDRERQARLDHAPLHVFRFHVSFRKQALGREPASAADVPIWSGRTTSAAVLNANMCAALANPNVKQRAIARGAPIAGR